MVVILLKSLSKNAVLAKVMTVTATQFGYCYKAASGNKLISKQFF